MSDQTEDEIDDLYETVGPVLKALVAIESLAMETIPEDPAKAYRMGMILGCASSALDYLGVGGAPGKRDWTGADALVDQDGQATN